MAIITLSLVAIYSSWNDLSKGFTTSHSVMIQDFDPQKVDNYSTSELKMFLVDKASMEPTKIASISQKLYEREAREASMQQNCRDCEVSLKNVSEALRDSQKRVGRLEAQIESKSFSKWINIALFLLFGGYAAILGHKKSYMTEGANQYDRKINLVTFAWAFLSSVVGLIF